MNPVKGKVLPFEPKTVGNTKILTTVEALHDLLADEMNTAATLGAMIHDLGPKMPMMNRILSPDEPMEPCLESFWTMLARMCIKIEEGEWK